jgi:hypothetical protein
LASIGRSMVPRADRSLPRRARFVALISQRWRCKTSRSHDQESALDDAMHAALDRAPSGVEGFCNEATEG